MTAVVKMASFGGGGRLGAVINYISRNGDVVVENERGEQLRGRDELSTVRNEWGHLMKNRAESRDIGTFVVEVKERFDGVGMVLSAVVVAGLSFGLSVAGFDIVPWPVVVAN